MVRLPYHLSAVTQAAALAALRHADELLARVDDLREERDATAAWLAERGLEVAESDANFVLFGRYADRHAVWQGLLDRGVLIREVGPAGWLRVSIGTPAEMAAFRDALTALGPSDDGGPRMEEEPMSRTAVVDRETKESKVHVEVDIDGSGRSDVSTGVGFYDHMLASFARHSLVDVVAHTSGDTHIDAHHTVEDTAIVLGEALREALGDKSGIRRFGDATVPLDEALVQAVVDVSGRPYCVHTGEPDGQAFVLIGRRLPRLADPSRLRDHRLPRPDRAARARAVGPRPAPPRRGAVQGVRARVPRRRGARPARDRRAVDQGFPLRVR